MSDRQSFKEKDVRRRRLFIQKRKDGESLIDWWAEAYRTDVAWLLKQYIRERKMRKVWEAQARSLEKRTGVL